MLRINIFRSVDYIKMFIRYKILRTVNTKQNDIFICIAYWKKFDILVKKKLFFVIYWNIKEFFLCNLKFLSFRWINSLRKHRNPLLIVPLSNIYSTSQPLVLINNSRFYVLKNIYTWWLKIISQFFRFFSH